MKRWRWWIGLSIVCSFFAEVAFAQTPLGTDFTYQGSLVLGGNPVNGTADFQFKLFGAPTGGSQIGSTQAVSNLTVSNGGFTATLDFGAVFNGDKRFLEIAVRSPAGSGSFTTLTPRQPLTASPYAFKVPGVDGFSLDASDGSPTDALFVGPNGYVGIGTTSPAAKLHTKGFEEGLRIDGPGVGAANSAWLSFRDANGTRLGYVGDGSGGDQSVYLTSDLADVHLYTAFGACVSAKPDGKVGIGTVTPTQKLHVNAGAIMVEHPGDQADLLWFASERSWVFRQEGTGSASALKLQSIGGGGNKNFIVQTDGFVGIGTLSPQAKLDVNGTARATVVEITGADLAEKFPTSEQVEPGMVLAIDTEHDGQLCLARGAYNRRVAGVVSGANGFSAGAVLGNLPGHEAAPPVALSGRVYVWCDAANAPIEAGDFLTTSNVPGHAMKAVDSERAQGAVLGKAMTSLASGRGMVLVLVNLQ